MTSSSETGGKSLKRKGPPEFRHLPIERAKKLKRDWVEKKKLKSQWRAQKRKEGLAVWKPAGKHADKTQQDTTLMSPEAKAVDHMNVEDESSSDGQEVEVAVVSAADSIANSQAIPRNARNHKDTQPTLSTNSVPDLGRPGQRQTSQRHGGHSRHDNKAGFGGRSKQPDMRQKMGDLLEKIQKTYSTSS